MARTMQVEGMDELSTMLTELGERAEEVAACSLYQGAAAMKNALNASTSRIRIEKFHYAKFEGTQRLPSPEEVEAIQNKVGVARFSKNGSDVNTSVGLQGAGYADVAGKQRPVIVIARSINSGTSFMRKQPFFRQAANAAKEQASAAIVAEAERRFNEIKG